LAIVTPETPLGISLAQLVVESETRAPEQAKTLIARVQKETGNSRLQREIIELVETIIIYKFPHISRQELEIMLGLGDLKETRFYQEAKQEGEQKAKMAAVPRLFQQGLTIEAIAEALELSLEDVRKAIQQ
jgi:predicted transposase/invertase (TIGR01784 family)